MLSLRPRQNCGDVYKPNGKSARAGVSAPQNPGRGHHGRHCPILRSTERVRLGSATIIVGLWNRMVVWPGAATGHIGDLLDTCQSTESREILVHFSLKEAIWWQ